MGSDESHFNVSVGSDGQSHRTVSTNHNLFEEKGERKRYRTEVLPLPLGSDGHLALPLGQTGSLEEDEREEEQMSGPVMLRNDVSLRLL